MSKDQEKAERLKRRLADEKKARAQAAKRLRQRPIYSPQALEKCKETLRLRAPENWQEIKTQIEALGVGYLKAQSKVGEQEPREGIEHLENFARAADALGKSFERLKRLQETNGILRQVLPNQIDRRDPRNTVNWDDADDAVNIIMSLGGNARNAAQSMRKELGTSPRRIAPGFAWAIEIFRIYRAHDVRGKLGNRVASVPFWAFLCAAAEPLELELSWNSVHDRISQDVLNRT